MILPRRALLPAALSLALLAVLAAPARADDLGKARSAVEAKSWAQAADLLAKVLGKSPDNREAALLAAEVATTGGVAEAFPLAEDALHALLKKNEKDRDVRIALGRVYLAKGRSRASDPTAKSDVAMYFADASDHFSKVLETAGGVDEAAAAGLVEVQYFLGDFEKAIATADGFLAKKPTAAGVNFWKGQVLYLQAVDAYRNEGPGSENAKSLFSRAKGCYEAAVKGNGASYEAWMQLAYAAQYTGDVETARQAYEKAMDLDNASEFPIKGIAALLANEPMKYAATLERLAKEHPKNLAVRWYLGWNLFSTKKYDEAIKVLAPYAKEAERPDAALVLLGRSYAAKGEDGKAKEHFEAALKANPENYEAAGELEKALQEKVRRVGGSAKAALELAEAYAPLLAAAPKNPYLRNNLGFALREALNAAGSSSGALIEVPDAWLPVLKASVKAYVEAAEAIGDFRPEMAAQPWATRYDFAGILNDAGLMLWYYPQVRDVEKAEDLYVRALDFTASGYRDACDNLVKLYLEKDDQESALRVAEECADALMDREGNPDAQGRAMARAWVERLSR